MSVSDNDGKKENLTLDGESATYQISLEEKMMQWELLVAETNVRLALIFPAVSGKADVLRLRLGARYDEQEAADIIDVGLHTLKRWRAGRKDKETGDWLHRPRLIPLVHFSAPGPRSITYTGMQLCRIMTGEAMRPDDLEECGWDGTPNGSSPSGIGGSASEKGSTTGAASTGVPDKRSVSALAQKTFSKQKTD